jgi:hypothetical protein
MKEDLKDSQDEVLAFGKRSRILQVFTLLVEVELNIPAYNKKDSKKKDHSNVDCPEDVIIEA